MNRTINERKAVRNISIYGIVNYISIFILIETARDPTIFFGAIGVISYIVSMLGLSYNCYSLGWEYKRISMNDAKGGKR